MAGVLHVVSTPIGNPEDLTFRALDVLRRVQWIAAENPQHTKRLLDHYAIETPMTTYHNLNKEEKTPLLIARLKEGQHGALVSDFGTPAIFDPGYGLISQAIASHIRVVPIPGPSAVVAAASCSGLRTDALIVHGYLPERSESRRRFLEDLRKERYTATLLVRRGCLRRTLELLHPVLGTRRLALAKNLTMPDEEFLHGTVADLLRDARQRPILGELTLVIEGVRRRPRGRQDQGVNQNAFGSSRDRIS
jgi:16S rRNA (cytidine1402-2'-O)-methyltransferase